MNRLIQFTYAGGKEEGKVKGEKKVAVTIHGCRSGFFSFRYSLYFLFLDFPASSPRNPTGRQAFSTITCP